MNEDVYAGVHMDQQKEVSSIINGGKTGSVVGKGKKEESSGAGQVAWQRTFPSGFLTSL